MDAELNQQLIDDYPILYEHCRTPPDDIADPTPTIALSGMECGDGWYVLLDAVSKLIETNVNEHDKRPTVRATQVKQKWGSLRIYTDPQPEFVHGIVRLAGELSRSICESCGVMQGVEQQEVDGWQVALCPSCDPPINY